jgi:ACS family hexuronate transporter-like MFS transporter
MSRRIPRLRWFVITLIFFATVINYIDRQTVSVLKKAISDDLGLSNADYAAIQNSFLVLYGISQMVSGRLYDRIGTRLGFVCSIVVWSFAAIMHATARTASSFRVWRGVLGFGEAGNWPGAAKAVGEWFPVKERALGMGIFNTGAALGGAVSPPIIAWLATSYGWRPTFVLTGLLGFAWLVAWLVVYRTPEQHAWITPAERAYILEGRSDPASAAAEGAAWNPGWRGLLAYRQTWAVVLGRFITDPIWWLYVFWLPSYFQEARGFSLAQIGWSAWFPFLCAGIGALSGGWASGHLIGRGWPVDRARKVVMTAGALLTPAGILAMWAQSPYVALALMGLVLFGFQVWVNNLQTLPSDFFPRTAVASVFGLGGTSAAIASVLYNWGTGRVVDTMGYAPMFVVAGLLGPIGLAVTLGLAGRIGPLSREQLGMRAKAAS